MGHARLGSEKGPRDEGDGRNDKDRGDEIAGDDVGKLLDRSPAPLCFGNHRHDPCQKRLCANLFRPHDKAAVGIDGGADDLISDVFLNRDRLSGDHRFVDGAGALKQNTIDRNLFARAHTQSIPYAHGIQGDICFGSVLLEATSRLCLHSQQLLDGLARLAACAQLQDLPEQDEGHNHSCRLEVDSDLAILPE